MAIDVDAVYEDGVLKLRQPVDLPERAEVHVTIEPRERAKTSLGRKLLELRDQIARSGAPTLGWDEVEEEVTGRRGGWRDTQ